MKNIQPSHLNYLLITAAAWTAAALMGVWLLDSALLRALKNGILAQTSAAALMAVIIAAAQTILVKGLRFWPWLLATAAGLILGANGAYLGWMASQLPILRGITGAVWLDCVLWWGYVFLLTGLGSLPAGILAGLGRKWAVSKGKTGAWIGTGVLNWAVSLGAAGGLLQLFKTGRYFYAGGFRSGPLLLRFALVGIVVGLLQGWILGRRLTRLLILEG